MTGGVLRMSISVRSAGAAAPPGSWGDALRWSKAVGRAVRPSRPVSGTGRIRELAVVLTRSSFRRKMNKRCLTFPAVTFVARLFACVHPGNRAWRLGNQQDFAGGPAAFKIPVGLGGFGERVRGRPPGQRGAVGGGRRKSPRNATGVPGRSGRSAPWWAWSRQRTRGVQPLRIKGRHRPGRSAEEHQAPRMRRPGQGIVEGVLADAVVHHVDAFAIGQFPDLVSEPS